MKSCSNPRLQWLNGWSSKHLVFWSLFEEHCYDQVQHQVTPGIHIVPTVMIWLQIPNCKAKSVSVSTILKRQFMAASHEGNRQSLHSCLNTIGQRSYHDKYFVESINWWFHHKSLASAANINSSFYQFSTAFIYAILKNKMLLYYYWALSLCAQHGFACEWWSDWESGGLKATQLQWSSRHLAAWLWTPTAPVKTKNRYLSEFQAVMWVPSSPWYAGW